MTTHLDLIYSSVVLAHSFSHLNFLRGKVGLYIVKLKVVLDSSRDFSHNVTNITPLITGTSPACSVAVSKEVLIFDKVFLFPVQLIS